MTKWETVTLGTICEIVSGTTPSTKNAELWDGDIKWITPAEIQNESYYIYDTERHISEKAGLRLMPAGTVLLSSRAPIGKVAIAGAEMSCNQGFKNLICSDRVHNRYLYHFLKSKTDYLNSLGRGATFKELSKSIVENVEIPLPTLPLQFHIADKLDAVTDILRLRNQQLVDLDLLVKSRFVEMFGNPVTNEKKWPIMQLGDAGNCKNGMNFRAGDTGVEINCLGVGDFKDLTKITEVESLPVVSLNAMPSSELLLRNEDIVFVRSNGNKELVGRCVVVYPDDIQATFSGFCIRFRKETNKLITEYLLQALKTSSMRLKMVGRGANINNLNQKTLISLPIPVPPMSLQKKFAVFIEQTDKSKFAIQQSITELETLKKALMQQYFG
ncbi:MAG: restriction endonuclease subunit S [Christensenellales bacterium]